MHSCYCVDVKTISLTDEAYERLRVWKEASGDSFSKVVLRVVPPKYSGASVAEAAQALPPLSEAQELAVHESVAEANDWTRVNDPWTSSQTQPT
jgi:predicted CopG family antitoxin